MQFFIDIGNTNIKCSANYQKFDLLFIKHKNIDRLFKEILTIKAKHLLITLGHSKKSRKSLEIIQNFAKKNLISIEIINIKPQLLAINYTDISQFGVDRFLHLLAARQRFKENFCIVSCGTAITLDFYTNKHIGGMIAPGLGISQKLLKKKTGLKSIKKTTKLLGDDTASSIGLGLYSGYKNMIYSNIDKIEKSINLTFTVIFSGGDAKKLASNDSIIIPELLFEGMRIYEHH